MTYPANHPGNVASDQLRAFVERVERLEEEIKALNGDKSEVYAEAKGNGFDVPTIKKVVRIRKMDDASRQEADAMLDLYMSALGMAPASDDEYSTPLVHVHAHEKATGDDTLDDLEGEASRLAAKIAARRQAMIRKPSPSDD